MTVVSNGEISADSVGIHSSENTVDVADDNQPATAVQLSVMQTAALVWAGVRSAPECWRLCVASLLSALLSGPFILSIYTGYAFGVMEAQSAENLSWIARQPLWLMSVSALVLLVLGAFSDYAVNNLAAAANAIAWRNNISRIFGAVLHAQSSAHNQAALHSVKSFLVDSVEVFQRHQLYILQNSLRAVLVVLLTLVYLLAHNPWFIAVVFAALALTFFTPIWLAKKAQPAIDAEPFSLNMFNRYLLSVLRLGSLLTYNDNRRLFQQLQHRLQRYVAVEGNKWITWNFAFNFKITLNLLTSASLLGIGGLLYFAGLIDIAELIAIYLLVSMAVPRLDSLYKIYNFLQSLKAYYQQAHYLQTLAHTGPASIKPWASIVHIELNCQLLQLPGQKQPLFENLLLQLERGKVYVFCGKSGSGKTTLLNMLLGFQVPDRGYLRVNHQRLEPRQLSAYWQCIALHEQHNLLIANLTALENIQLVKRPIDPERFERARYLLGLDQWGAKPVHQLSGGEVQRLCFLRAYIYVADVFVFDEPTSALDGINESLVKELLAALKNSIVLIVSHNPDFATIADQLWTFHGDGYWHSERGGRQ
jgi:ABC-type multidrug transport system fused ATPase/permease subunit